MRFNGIAVLWSLTYLAFVLALGYFSNNWESIESGAALRTVIDRMFYPTVAVAGSLAALIALVVRGTQPQPNNRALAYALGAGKYYDDKNIDLAA